MLNNGVHAVPTAHWENWKYDQSILNMEAIDNKVFFFLMISLINIPFYCFIKINIKNVMPRMGQVRKLQIYSLGWGFIIRAAKKVLWKEVKRVLESQ